MIKTYIQKVDFDSKGKEEEIVVSITQINRNETTSLKTI